MDMLSDTQVPFVFMNAVGSKDDVETLLHEGGHSFHYYLARKLPFYSYHATTHEFSEVASMSMELLSRPYLDEFYSDEELAAVVEGPVARQAEVFPVYGDDRCVPALGVHGDGLRARRPGARSGWSLRSGSGRADWKRVEQYREFGWQYPHVFDVPFYYVEYGIAQLAALRIWLNSLEDEGRRWRRRSAGCRSGGSRHCRSCSRRRGRGSRSTTRRCARSSRGRWRRWRIDGRRPTTDDHAYCILRSAYCVPHTAYSVVPSGVGGLGILERMF